MDMSQTPANTPVNDREQRKAEQARVDRARARKAKLAGLGRLFGIVAVIVAIIGGLIYLAERQESHAPQPNPVSAEITEIDHVRGNPDAQVIVMEYADLQCPACRSYAPVIDQLAEEYGDRVAFVYRHFPLKTIHPNAVAAARAAEAAHLQGKFWEMHDELFSEQNTWSKLANPTSTFADMAAGLGLDRAKFEEDMNSTIVKDRVEADYRSGLSAGISSTPTFYINGQPLEEGPRGIEPFRALIDAELSKIAPGESTEPTETTTEGQE